MGFCEEEKKINLRLALQRKICEEEREGSIERGKIPQKRTKYICKRLNTLKLGIPTTFCICSAQRGSKAPSTLFQFSLHKVLK